MVTDGGAVHPVSLGGNREFNQLAWRELFSGCFVSESQFNHSFFLLLVAIASAAGAGRMCTATP